MSPRSTAAASNEQSSSISLRINTSKNKQKPGQSYIVASGFEPVKLIQTFQPAPSSTCRDKQPTVFDSSTPPEMQTTKPPTDMPCFIVQQFLQLFQSNITSLKECNESQSTESSSLLQKELIQTLQMIITQHYQVFQSITFASACHEWHKIRDLPPSLMGKVDKPSAAVFLCHYELRRMLNETNELGAFREFMRSEILLFTVQRMSGLYRAIKASRFHSRHLRVDVLSLERVFSACFESIKNNSNDAFESETMQLVLQSIEGEILELGTYVIVLFAHLNDLVVLARKLNELSQNLSEDKETSDVDVAHESKDQAKKFCSVLSKCCPELDSITSFSTQNYDEADPFKIYFDLPKINGQAITEQTKLQIDMTPLILLCQEHPQTDFVSLLKQLISKRHELNVDDYPELTTEETQIANELRALLDKLKEKD